VFEVTIGIDPNIARVGPFLLTWHGVFTALAIVAGLLLAHRELRRRGRALPNFDTFAVFTVIGGVVGARLFYVLDHPELFAGDLLRVLAVQEGGLTIYGAVVGGFVAVLLLSRIYRQPFGVLADSVAPGLLLAQAIGRIGCLVNGDAWGGPCTCLACAGVRAAVPDGNGFGYCPFAVTYTHPGAILPRDLLGVPTHPYPVYDIVVNLLVLAVVWRLRGRPLPSGALFALAAVLYSAGRFVVSFVRQERVWFWGLQQAQVIAIVAGVAALVALVWLLRRPAPATTPAA
jgi:phosphatidylglycerol:prolipoprotein diacylglycerol transferase